SSTSTPTRADWEDLERRAKGSRRQARWGLALGLVAMVLALGLGIGGAAIYVAQRDVPKVLDRQSEPIRKINTIVAYLRDADRDRSVANVVQIIALAQVVEGVAAGFATSPYPDPARVDAVEKLCEIARGFRMQVAPGNPIPACPAV